MNDLDDIIDEIRVSDMDFVFISYDEPDCERNWSETLHRIPWAKRVHGVTGFDAAHKRAASICSTSRLITIDGDSIPDREILDKTLRIRAGIRRHVFSWRAKNIINGLCYGNGSLKCWPRETMLNMQTHENTTEESGSVDFCWSIPYSHMKSCCSITDPGGSPYQAFRSGFREGIKTVLDRGKQVPPHQMRQSLWYGAIQRIQVWCGIGADTEHGLWAIYGARCGLSLMMEYPSSTFHKIADYNWFLDMFREKVDLIGGHWTGSHQHAPIRFDPDRLISQIHRLGEAICIQSGIELILLNPDQSRVMKTMIDQPYRGHDPMVEE